MWSTQVWFPEPYIFLKALPAVIFEHIAKNKPSALLGMYQKQAEDEGRKESRKKRRKGGKKGERKDGR